MLWGYRAQDPCHLLSLVAAPAPHIPQNHLTTYLLAKETQGHSPVHQGHSQHREVGQQPQVLLELGPPDQIALQDMGTG